MIPEPIKRDIIYNADDITMQKILNSEIPHTKHIDISTGYFDVAGYGLLRESLDSTVQDPSFAMRLLLGKEAILPTEDSFEKYAEQYQSNEILSIKTSLDKSDLTQKSRSDTMQLIDLLLHDNVQVRIGASKFNHSKCYILGDNAVFIGSSNFTAGGLTGNYELNAGLYQPGVAERTRAWFDRMWDDAEDTKQDLIDTLRQSKFGIPPEPFSVYMKMLFERFRPLLADMGTDTKNSITLTKFQQDAVKTGLFITNEFGGTMIADATGLGKTNIGMEIIRQKILHEGKKVLLIAPSQVLHTMWEEKLKDVDFKVRETLTMEALSRDSIFDDLAKYKKIDLILIDESQNFRSKTASRRENLMKLMSIGKKKQAILLSATPINNSLMDLYYQLSIITGGDDSYFYKTIGIPDLYQYMRNAANKDGLHQGLEKIQQLLDSIMVRRTRSYIKEIYPDSKINGAEIKFPRHEYAPIRYSLSDLFGNIFQKVLDDMSSLTMAPYGLGWYDKSLPEAEQKKSKVFATLQVILLLKMFESSVEAIKTSLANKINLYRHVRAGLDRGLIFKIKDFAKVIKKLNMYDGDSDDIDPKFFTDEIKKIKQYPIGPDYDLDSLRNDMDSDMTKLKNLLSEIEKITIDTKMESVERIILKERALDNESKKVLIFTEYVTTAEYITKNLKDKLKGRVIECIHGKTNKDTRKKYIRRFAPNANLLEDETLNEPEIDILVSTEVLAEGQNLQDCNYIINYDLPWNPMRIVQRTGRIDRLTSRFDVIHSRACYPDMELDGILKLVGKLLEKIETVNEVVGLDVELLGTMPAHKQFNGSAVKRIQTLQSGDGMDTTIEAMERESDVMPATSPINELSRYIKTIGMEAMKEIPFGRRSGKNGERQSVVLAYMEKPGNRVHFVIYDYKKNVAFVPDDDFDAIRNAACIPTEETHLPMDGPSNQESFEELLKIDMKARTAIAENNNKVRQYVVEARQKTKNKHVKNRDKINMILLDEISQGRILVEEGQSVMDVIKSGYSRPWENDIADMIDQYEQNKEVDTLITRLKLLGQSINIGEELEEEKDVTASEDVSLRLVGAMFITPEKFDFELGKNGLDKYE